MGVSPEKCIVIEDAPAGIEAAQRAGMKAIGVLTTHSDLVADWVFKSVAELPHNFFARLAL
jgi:beta-phosphoglucomutase